MMTRKRRPRKQQRATAQVGAALLLGLVAVQLLLGGDSSENDSTGLASSATSQLRRMLSSSSSENDDGRAESTRVRPKMYTFYNRVETFSAEETDQQILDLWKSEWTRAGFDVQILTLDDAKKHERFPAYERSLREKVKLHSPIEYNIMCFYRWLAMATVGGGYMSDYDTLPLLGSYDLALEGEELPNGGKFTLFDYHVPSMMAGSADEWTRLANEILDSAIAQTDGKETMGDGTGETSDMVALLPVISRHRGEEGVMHHPTRVIGTAALDFVDMDRCACSELRKLPAVHFSHQVIDLHLGVGHDDERPEVMRKWMDHWRAVCANKNISDPMTLAAVPRKLSQGMFESTLMHHTMPELDTCEIAYRDHPQMGMGWYRPIEPSFVPPGSRLELNNNFRAGITTSNLNVFFMGDSVGENLANFYMQSHSLPKCYGKSDMVYKKNMQGKQQEIYWANDLPESYGGGSVAFARVLRLWKEKNRGDSASFRGWEPHIFEDYVQAHGNADVLVYRTPWPWMCQEEHFLNPNERELEDVDKIGHIPESDYDEVLALAHKYLRPHTVILVTTPMNNNALRVQGGIEGMRKDNEAIRSFVANYKPPANAEDGIQNVLLMDWEKLVDAAILANAEVLGIPPSEAFEHSLTGKNVEEKKKRMFYPQLTAMTCSGTTPTNEAKEINECPEDLMGRISPDGMHFCGATLAPRSTGGLACLMKCAVDVDEYESDRASFLDQCQKMCNDLFMSMDTVLVAEAEDAEIGHLELP